MDIKGDRIEVTPVKRDADGKQISPEEAPAERVLDVEIPLTAGGNVLGALGRAEVRMAGTAIEFASGFKNRCEFCRFFDNNLFRQVKVMMEESSDKEIRERLNQLRGLIMSSDHEGVRGLSRTPDYDLDIEHALSQMGICHALTEVYDGYCFVHPLGGCPDYPGPKGESLGEMFRPASSESERAGVAGYDSIMLGAAGKK